jgi:hypothetical protein
MNNLAPTHQTGNTQLAVYDFSTKQLLIQYSGQKLDAFYKPAIKINLEGLFQSQYK